jgi:oligopeptide/dipeptide ABC transporter ATP-binding protein
MSEKLLSVVDLHTEFILPKGPIKVVDGVNFEIFKGEIFGIVGESGSGKTTLALSILNLIPSPPGKITSGEIILEDIDLLKLSLKELRKVRGNRVAMIFQDAATSLNPVITIGNQIIEPICLHQNLSKREAKAKAIELLETVNIPKAEDFLRDYPHELSGGMKQRVMIAMALACQPDIIIADEPTTALDTTIQAQILELMSEIKKEMGTSIILITHDLGIIAEVSERVLIMYAGRVVEYGDVDAIYYDSKHPYTWGLLNSVARIDIDKKFRLRPIKGLPPDLINLPSGCSFHPRCELVQDICRLVRPQLEKVSPKHFAACHLTVKMEDGDGYV